MKARSKPRDVDVSPLTNGNLLVEELSGERRVYRPDEFDALFEVITDDNDDTATDPLRPMKKK